MNISQNRRRYQVYPHNSVTPLIGDSTPAFNEVLETWAAFIEEASAVNDRLFAPQEWEELAEALADTIVPNGIPAHLPGGTGVFLAGLLSAREAGQKLAAKVAQMSVPCTWAMIYSLRYYLIRGKEALADKEWWTTECRKNDPIANMRHWSKRFPR